MKIKFAAVALLAAVSSASAADMARPYTKAPMASPAYNWTGFYVGAMGGYGWTANTAIDINGGFGGGTVGYNWQMSPNWVIGIEGEGAGASIRGSGVVPPGALLTDRIGAFGSVAGRLGYTWGPAMLYAKGGFAAASNKLDITLGAVSLSETRTHTGWTAGGGLEWMFAPSWSVKGEYLFARYSSQNYFATLVAGGRPSGDIDVHTVKGGVNYHFNWGPVVAKY